MPLEQVLKLARDFAYMHQTMCYRRDAFENVFPNIERNYSFAAIAYEYCYGSILDAIDPQHFDAVRAAVNEGIAEADAYFAEHPVTIS